MPVLAHIAALLEPLLFLPAFVAVIGAIVGSLRRRTDEDDPNSEGAL
jgi:hypothetical protein